MVQITQDQVAENLLFPIWRCLSDEYKDKYKKDIWEQFENGIRAAAYTSLLSQFLQNITKKLPMMLQAQFTKQILSVVNSGQDKQILNWLRKETTFLTLTVRLMNESRKENFKAQKLDISDLNPDELIAEIPFDVEPN